MTFFTSLTGLNAAQNELSALSNNIANVGTSGFKKSDVQFGDIVSRGATQAANSVAGVGVQSTVRNPLAEPGLLGITAGAGLGAVIVVTTGLGGGGRAVLVALAVIAGLATFAIVALLAWRGGLQPDRFVLIGIGCGYALTAVTTFLLLRSDPWETPRILTWLSGTTYGRSLPDVVPVFVALLIATPLLVVLRRHLDLLAVDDDTPRILGIQLERTCLGVLAIAAVLAAVSVVAVGTVSFVGLVAPHLARGLVGARHSRVIPVATAMCTSAMP